MAGQSSSRSSIEKSKEEKGGLTVPQRLSQREAALMKILLKRKHRCFGQKLEYPEVGVTELTLSNGMQVCYKSTDFLDDQVLFTGFAYGGLSELPESDYISCSMGSTIAGEIGMFGYKPSMLMDMLAGGDIGCGSGDEFIIFPPSGRVEDKQTKIFRLSLCQTSSYNTTSVGLAYSHVNTSFSPRKCVEIWHSKTDLMFSCLSP
ncbi:hypothetical protein Bca4012_049978 [Brassica carinata]|uniref:Uncharacterized protein n=1 Tax=Brassica carinata TaxID=52824 RepID=A0A8X7UL21_BRACI|nr:hypothetical protein Bca52824_052726 [Brassica carinata]